MSSNANMLLIIDRKKHISFSNIFSLVSYKIPDSVNLEDLVSWRLSKVAREQAHVV